MNTSLLFAFYYFDIDPKTAIFLIVLNGINPDRKSKK